MDIRFDGLLCIFGHRYAESIGATHFVTSAKLNSGIEEAFLDIAHRESFPDFLFFCFQDDLRCEVRLGH